MTMRLGALVDAAAGIKPFTLAANVPEGVEPTTAAYLVRAGVGTHAPSGVGCCHRRPPPLRYGRLKPARESG